MTFEIRDATPGDAPQIVEFNLRLAAETEGKVLDPARLERGVRAVLADPGRGRYLVAADAGRVIGQVMITYEWSDWRDGMIWWLQSVYVGAAHRRRGVFRALFEHVLALSRRDPGVAGIRLYVDDRNAAAEETYLRLGMARAGYSVLELLEE